MSGRWMRKQEKQARRARRIEELQRYNVENEKPDGNAPPKQNGAATVKAPTTNEEFEASILERLKEEDRVLSFGSERQIDNALKRLKRRGLIEFARGLGWTAVSA